MTFPKRCNIGLIKAVEHGASSLNYKQHLHFCDKCEAFHDYLQKCYEHYLPTYDDDAILEWARERGVE